MKNYISWRSVLQQIFKLFPPNLITFLRRGRTMSIAASISPVESLPNMFRGADANDRDRGLPHKNHLNQTTQYIVVARVAIWTAWRPHIWRQVLWHIIIQLRKCISLCVCTSAIVLEYVMVSTPREWFLGKSAMSIIFTSDSYILGRVSTGENRYCSYMFPRLRKMIGYGGKSLYFGKTYLQET